MKPLKTKKAASKKAVKKPAKKVSSKRLIKAYKELKESRKKATKKQKTKIFDNIKKSCKKTSVKRAWDKTNWDSVKLLDYSISDDGKVQIPLPKPRTIKVTIFVHTEKTPQRKKTKSAVNKMPPKQPTLNKKRGQKRVPRK